MLFSTAAAEYMDDKKKRLRATALEGYRSAIRCHLMPKSDLTVCRAVVVTTR